jgi:hypothetical protein
MQYTTLMIRPSSRPSFDFNAMTKKVKDPKRHIIKGGGFFKPSQIAALPYHAVEMFNDAHDQGLRGDDLEYRFPSDESGDQDLHRNREMIELHLSWYHVAGRIVAKAKADKQRYKEPTQKMRDLLGSMNKEAWKTTLIALHRTRHRVLAATDDCGM